MFKRIVFLLILIICSSQLMAQSKALNEAWTALQHLKANPNATADEQKKVVEMFQKVADSTPSEAGTAYLFIGETYSRRVAKHLWNDDLSLKYYQKSENLLPSQDANKGNALYNIALAYYYDTPYQDLSLAHSYLSQAADYDHKLAGGVGNFYEFGIGCEQNPVLAAEFYLRAINAGVDKYASFYAVDYYMKQLQKERLDTTAYEAYKKAQMMSIAGGMSREDTVLYMQLVSKAASLGYIPAYYELGTKYLFDSMKRDSAENMAKAIANMKVAADSDYIPAMYQLAAIYEYAYKGNEGKTMAAPYFEKAAQWGYPPAQSAMGMYNFYGYAGRTADADLAEIWFRKSADQGWPYAKQWLDYLNKLEEERSRAEQKAAAQKLLAEKDEKDAEKVSKKKSGWKAVLAFLGNVANVIADIGSVQTEFTSRQSSSMQQNKVRQKTVRISSNSSTTVSDGSPSERGHRLTGAQVAQIHQREKIYSDWASQLSNMYYGLDSYNDARRRHAQAEMRSIREKCEAMGLWHGSSQWETWDGRCKKRR